VHAGTPADAQRTRMHTAPTAHVVIAHTTHAASMDLTAWISWVLRVRKGQVEVGEPSHYVAGAGTEGIAARRRKAVLSQAQGIVVVEVRVRRGAHGGCGCAGIDHVIGGGAAAAETLALNVEQQR